MNHYDLYFYVACTESLKREINHGLWIDAAWELEEINTEIDRMISSSLFDQTNWRITRYETPAGFDFLSDQSPLERLHEMAKFIAQHGELGVGLLRHFDGDTLEAKDSVSDRNVGQFESIEQFIKMRIKQDYLLPNELMMSLDYKKLWQVWQRKYYVAFSVNGNKHVHVFRK